MRVRCTDTDHKISPGTLACDCQIERIAGLKSALTAAEQRAEEAEERLQGWEDGSGAGALQVQQHMHGLEERLAVAHEALREIAQGRMEIGGQDEAMPRAVMMMRARAALPTEEGR